MVSSAMLLLVLVLVQLGPERVASGAGTNGTGAERRAAAIPLDARRRRRCVPRRKRGPKTLPEWIPTS